MQTITTVGLDIAKSVFQVHGVDANGEVVLRPTLPAPPLVAESAIWRKAVNLPVTHTILPALESAAVTASAGAYGRQQEPRGVVAGFQRLNTAANENSERARLLLRLRGKETPT
jgi:hypothetical protein